MTRTYADRLATVPTATNFDQLLALTGPSAVARAILLDRARILLQLDLGSGKDTDIKRALAESPLEFYRLVSNFLADFPAELIETDRDKIVDGLTIEVEPQSEFLKVNEDGLWLRYLTFQTPPADLESDALKLAWLDAKGSEIVPFSIYEFLRAAVTCYRAGLFPGALALGAIALEASLKDTLRRANRHLIERRDYKTASGRIDAYPKGEDIQFRITIEGAPLKLKEYFDNQRTDEAQYHLGNIKFNIRRRNSDEESADQRVLELIPKSEEHEKLFAPDTLVETPTRREARRFAQLCDLAEQYGYFQSENFNPESVYVLRQVRNRIVHWDEQQINDAQIREMSLRDYITEPHRVQKTLADLAEFVSYLFESAEVFAANIA